jgi:Zn-dependent protease/CBS domain-containing protein
MHRSFSLGTFFGIELRANWSWPVAFGLVLWLLAAQYFPASLPGLPSGTVLSLAFATAVFLLVSIAAHELGHGLVGKRLGLPVTNITLFIFGGTAELGRQPERPRDEFLIAAAGPLVNLVFALGFGALAWAGPDAVGLPLVAVGHWLAMVNLALGLFNLLPGLPFDGGRMLHAVVWGRGHNARRATQIAGVAGRLIAFGLLVWGFALAFRTNWADGLWLVLIAWMIDQAAAQAVARATLQGRLAGHTVREAMLTDCPRVGPAMNLSQFMSQVAAHSRRRCFPVAGGDRVTGLITLPDVVRISARNWPTTTVGAIMTPVKDLRSVSPDADLFDSFEQMAEARVDQLAVVENGQLVGMVAWENVFTFLGAQTPLEA